MTETEEPHAPGREQDLRVLIDQVHAGVLLCEEVLDEQQPGWDAAKKGPRQGGGPSGPAGVARGQLLIVFINLGHLLINDHGVEPWSIAPLPMRGDAEVSEWQFGAEGALDVSTGDPTPPTPRRAPPTPVRPVENPREPRYTLAEARQILATSHEHWWEVVSDDQGVPVEIRCLVTTCSQRRPVG